ncbi:MAG: NHL repeat-containing protein [Acidimicrobiia bacterium]|nr:NHL repeat-containing protein [Acidimicrobiia bacterium]
MQGTKTLATAKRLVVVLLVVAGILMGSQAMLTQARGGSSGGSRVAGVVQVAGDPVAGWRVELYAAGRDGARLMDTTSTNHRGEFRLRARPRARDGITAYVVARNGDTKKMLAVLDPSERPDRTVINELSTIASIWTNSQFIDGDTISGNDVGLVAAARNIPNLVDLESGGLGEVVQTGWNGNHTNTLATLNSLASLLSDCLTDGCAELFIESAPDGVPVPTDTVAAFHNIARNPWHNVDRIFSRLQSASDNGPDNPAFIPTLLWPPTGWTLSLVYTGAGFNAPGEMAIDDEGGLWSNNNFVPGSQSVLLDVGGIFVPDPKTYTGTGVTKLSSSGEPESPPSGYLGGGTFGGAFGTAVDLNGDVWIGNFAGNSVTKLDADGTPISPDASTSYGSDGGYHYTLDGESGFQSPQSTIITEDNSLWVTNLGGNTVSQLLGGDPGNIRTWGADPSCAHVFSNPWGLASDDDGRVFVSNAAGRNISMIDPSTATDPLCPSDTYPLDSEAAPQGLATDIEGNVWVADTYGGKVTFLDAANGYTPTTFDAEGTTVGPWSVAVDGRDNVWVADFFGKRILNLCGASGNCPEGMQGMGDRISPAGRTLSSEAGMGGGYGANAAIQSITAIEIDQAGNVWVANNFDNDLVCLAGAGIPPVGGGSTVGLERLQTECGGNGAVVVFGVAAPVGAPILGQPRQP